jgi:AraC-like DNA-binding protein
MALLVDTQTVAPAERFEFWSEAASNVLHPLGLRHLATQPFRGRMRRWHLGPVELFRVEGDASSISRTPATIALEDPEQLQLALLLRGRFLVSQSGRSAHSDRKPARVGAADLLGRIQADMLADLADPGLTPARIAGQHYISVRLLHRLFAAEGTTVGRWLRERRLERCHRDLADPTLRHLAAAEIASAWGFRSPSHFSRLFSAAYGYPPGEVRRRPRPSAGG